MTLPRRSVKCRRNDATIPIFSTVTGTLAEGREFDAAYWTAKVIR